MTSKLRNTSMPISDIIPLLQSAADHIDELESNIDRLLLEYEPNSMTPGQLQRWSEHQRPV